LPNATQPARGMRDFLPEDLRRREYVIGVIRDVYERYGFEPLETPAVENIETLLGKYGEEGNKLIFKILKRGEHEASGEADLALRYDLTVPLARVVAEYQAKLPKFFKRYQIQPVWRADRPARGRFREFFQCDVDVVGSTSLMVEVELCSAVSDVLTRLNFHDFSIRLNHRGLLKLLLEALLNLPAPTHAQALVALDKLDKIGIDGVADELEKRGILSRSASLAGLRGMSEHALPKPLPPSLKGLIPQEQRLEKLRQAILGLQPNIDLAPIEDLVQVLRLSEKTSASGRVVIDPFIARGLDYYTGAIMEIAVPDLAGSLGGGGRYDNLIGMFLGRDIPACGFSLGLERILVVMSERNLFPESVVRGPSDIMITQWSEETRAEALALAATLRAAGVRVDVYPEVDKIGKQFKYASARHVPLVAVLGDEERGRGEVTIKDMRSGEQHAVGLNQVTGYVRDALSMG
jgi:histidyl-tRNA synthetase